ncbi:hypothetical protein [Roseimaritima ulvae]|uniref:Uncharacterized protein n=1 Tax=Roseimaritima ulvae TaxID=980254 RepID=A0A5B9QP41_9BACT|nr:hypothetical protein [Roseimaritima ulvae]QEG40734.1 hypothetical protein UC8_27510 [Roseimaritima ulvae]
MPDSRHPPADSPPLAPAAAARQQVTRRARRPQISIAFMLLSMTILCAMSAAMFYASRVPAIYGEVFSWFGKEVEPQETKRTVHLTFLLFTYASPLLLACLLGVVVSVLRWFSPEESDEGPSSPWDEG